MTLDMAANAGLHLTCMSGGLQPLPPEFVPVAPNVNACVSQQSWLTLVQLNYRQLASYNDGS